MSRCKCCNRIMSDFEMTRKYKDGTYVDMCNKCFKASETTEPVIERRDLSKLDDDDSVLLDIAVATVLDDIPDFGD